MLFCRKTENILLSLRMSGRENYDYGNEAGENNARSFIKNLDFDAAAAAAETLSTANHMFKYNLLKFQSKHPSGHSIFHSSFLSRIVRKSLHRVLINSYKISFYASSDFHYKACMTIIFLLIATST